MPAPTPAGRAIRAHNVGGSEVGALLGEHPYTTPLAIYARLVNAVEVRTETAAMRLGDRLEPAVARLAAENLGLQVRRCSRTYTHPATRLAASPDFIVLNAPELLEIKVSGDYGIWGDVPAHVAWQARAQLACTDRERVHVAALVGTSLRTFNVVRDAEAERRMLDAVDRFFDEHVDPRIPPADSDASAELVLTIANPAGTVAASGALEDVGDLLADVSARRKREESAENELRDRLARLMAAADARLVLGHSWRAEVVTTGRGVASLRFTNGAPMG